MSKSAWWDSNSKGDILKLHDTCYKPKCKCQKQITFNTHQFQLEGAGFKNTMKSIYKGPQPTRINFLKPAVIVAAP